MGFGKCEVCGIPLMQPGGYAGLGMCGPCTTGEADTMFDTTDGGPDCDWRVFREEQAKAKQERTTRAASEYHLAAEKAKTFGLNLIQHNNYHYSLRGPRCFIHLYPSNGRIYSPKKGEPGFLGLPHGWSLMDAVEAAAEKIRKSNTIRNERRNS